VGSDDERSTNRTPLFATIAADTISRTGNVLTAIAVPWFVLVTTGSAAKTGIAAFAGALPVFISLFFGGVIVDSFSYRRVSVVADLASGLSVGMIPLLYALDRLSFPLLLAFIFVGALLDLPAGLARIAALPDLATLGGMSTERAFALAEGASTVLALAAPALAGVMIAAVGASNVLWVDAASFAVSAVLMAARVPDTFREGIGTREGTTNDEMTAAPEAGGVPGAGGAPGAGAVPDSRDVIRVTGTLRRYREELVAGLRFVRFEPVLFPLILFFAAMNLAIGPVEVPIVAVYAKEVFGSPIAFGLMAAAGGVGALAGTALMGWLGHRVSRRAIFFGGFLTVPLALAGLAFRPGLAITLVILGLLGLALGLTNIAEYSIYFERIPREMRARVIGLTGAIGFCTVPIGRLLGGFLLQKYGLTGTLAALAIIFLPVSLTFFAVRAFRDLGSPDGNDNSKARTLES